MNETAAKPYAKNGIAKLAGAALSMGVILVAEVAAYYLSYAVGGDDDLFMTAGAAVAGVGMTFALGGASYLRPRLDEIFEAFKYMWWILAISFVFMVWDIWDYVDSGYALDPHWLKAVLNSLLLCIAIGFSEEAQFRVLATGGLLAKSGATKRGIWIAIVLGAIYFGQAHIYWSDIDFGDILSVVQALLKVLQTGMYAVMLAALMLKHKSIWGIALVHCIDDYLLFVSSGLFGDSLEVEYVSTGSTEEAMGTIIFYVIVCALYVPTLFKAIRTINREIETPQFGPFVADDKVVWPGQEAALPIGEQGYPYGQPALPYDDRAPYGQGYPQQAPYGDPFGQGPAAPQVPYQQEYVLQDASGQGYAQGSPQQAPTYGDPSGQVPLAQPYAQQPYVQQGTGQPLAQQSGYQQAPQQPQAAYQQGYAPQQPQAPYQQGYAPQQPTYYPIPQTQQSELPNSTFDPAAWQQMGYPQQPSYPAQGQYPAQQAPYPAQQQAPYPAQQYPAQQQVPYPAQTQAPQAAPGWQQPGVAASQVPEVPRDSGSQGEEGPRD